MSVPARVTALLTHRPSFLTLNVGMVLLAQTVQLVVKRNQTRSCVVNLKMVCVVMMENIAVLNVSRYFSCTVTFHYFVCEGNETSLLYC